ncbi:hypothetical protein GGR56DRAFT_666112 [Xylariaceae sp. FL0804]|nr:hypothetical protein GGR56DRAFT_666112 [Xylariaceae sp. FL0804]
MFGGSRRHRPLSQAFNSGPSNPNATTAAASAFMSASSQKRERSLSSAAAAAALRARPQTPTNVGDVQTKRTARRSASLSSTSSAPAAAGKSTPRLTRRGSSSSMTERTFRSPSPRRSTPAQGSEPPVPEIPATHRKSTANSAAAGVGMQKFQTASQKMNKDQPSWYTQPSGDPKNVRTSDAPIRAAKPPPLAAMDSAATSQRPDSRGSPVNYSYPSTFRPMSPSSPTTNTGWELPPPRTPVSPPRSSNASVSPPTRTDIGRMVPQVDSDATTEYKYRQAAERPPRRKKNDDPPQREGSRLAKGTVSRAQGTAESHASSTMADSAELSGQQPVKASVTTQHEQQRSIHSVEPQRSKVQSPSAPSERALQDQMASSPPNQHMGRRLSSGPEEFGVGYEDAQTARKPSHSIPDILDAVPTRQSRFEDTPDAQSQLVPGHETLLAQPASSLPAPELEARAPHDAKESGPIHAENKPVAELREEGSVRRSNSNSPVRQTRFATTPAGTLAVRHTPLPRSASPIKSALKHTSANAREASPSDVSSNVSRSGAASPNQREEPIVPRKKAVRVSFDDQSNVVVGQSAPPEDAHSPVSGSPQQGKRPWYSSLGRGKKKEYTLEDDEVMKPRPALPSFGSVRDKVVREPEERPLVRPLEPSYSPAMPSSPELRPQSSSTLADSEMAEEQLGQSADHALGSVIAQDQNSRNEANISRFREPLPPVVTSLEGNGYLSDSNQSSDSENEPDRDMMGASDTPPGTQPTQITQPDDEDKFTDAPTMLEGEGPAAQGDVSVASETSARQDIPEISVLQPTPTASDHQPPLDDTSKYEYFDVPGRFPDYESDEHGGPEASGSHDTSRPSTKAPADTILEPDAAVQSVQAGLLPQTTLVTNIPTTYGGDKSKDDTDDTDNSIYSDAYEDLSDADAEGFISLDAVVESPISKVNTSQPPEFQRDVPRPATAEKSDVQQQPHVSKDLQSSMASQSQDEWEQAKSFWRNLTAEKRRQLELETTEDAGTEGDREEVAQPVRRNNSRRKTVEEKQFEAISQSQTLATASQPSRRALRVDPDRVYMIQPGSRATHEPSDISPTQPRMRTSLRGETPAKTGKVAKAPPPGGMRKTMRANGGTAPAARSYTPATAPQSERIASSSARPTTQRRGSDASDSSFRRSRASAGDGFGFRRTMRAHSPPEQTKGSGRFSLRSLSPTGSAFQRGSTAGAPSGTAAPRMRQSLRSEPQSTSEGKRSAMRLSSFGRASNQGPVRRSEKSSRLADSSDEDEGPRPGFRTRFEDSSDEEDVGPSTPTQGRPMSRGTLRTSATAPAAIRRATPVPEEEEDSPELPDSEDDLPSPLRSPQSRRAAAAAASRAGTVRTNSAIGTSTLSGTGSGRGGLVGSGPSSMPTTPSGGRRNSFMGMWRRNKRADEAGKIQRSEVMESAARRDTRLERNSGQLRGLRSEAPSSPKLQKRGVLKRGDSWAAPEADGSAVMQQRPSTADSGVGQAVMSRGSSRPTLADRRSMSLNLPKVQEDDEMESVIVDGAGQKKKKKFGALRRMFRLDD